MGVIVYRSGLGCWQGRRSARGPASLKICFEMSNGVIEKRNSLGHSAVDQRGKLRCPAFVFGRFVLFGAGPLASNLDLFFGVSLPSLRSFDCFTFFHTRRSSPAGQGHESFTMQIFHRFVDFVGCAARFVAPVRGLSLVQPLIAAAQFQVDIDERRSGFLTELDERRAKIANGIDRMNASGLIHAAGPLKRRGSVG